MLVPRATAFRPSCFGCQCRHIDIGHHGKTSTSPRRTLSRMTRNSGGSSTSTAHATAALADLGLLTEFDPDRSLLVTDPQAAADLDEAGVVALHRSGALALLHAGLVSHAHLAWMEKAERLLTAAPPPRPSPASDRQRIVPGSRFLAALAADQSADEALIQFSGLTRQ
jgi:hypothetical protein